VAEIEEPERVNRPQKITLGEMRAMGVRGLLVYCSDYHCITTGRKRRRRCRPRVNGHASPKPDLRQVSHLGRR
jgi:hypothetical protein